MADPHRPETESAHVEQAAAEGQDGLGPRAKSSPRAKGGTSGEGWFLDVGNPNVQVLLLFLWCSYLKKVPAKQPFQDV